MKYVAPIRKELGIRTVFNILGPLTNPAKAPIQLMGVYEEALVPDMAKVLRNLGIKRGMVVYGQDKLDEISLSAPTSVCEIVEGNLHFYEIAPEQFGIKRCEKEALRGGTPEENAVITREILQGKKGARRDAVLMNAGAALYIAGRAADIESGIRLAEETIDSKRAQKQLMEFIRLSQKEEKQAC